MKDIIKSVYNDYKYLVKQSDKGVKFVDDEEIDKLNLTKAEKGLIKKVLNIHGINIIVNTITRKDRPKTVKDFNYGEIETLGIEHLDKPVLSKIIYDGEEIVFEDYDDLDYFIKKQFIPDNIQMKVNRSKNTKDLELEKPYPSIQLNKIVKLGFSEKEIKHIIEVLKDEGIHIGGKSQDVEDNNDNYDYINTYEGIVNNYCDKFFGGKITSEEMQEKFVEYFETRDPLLREELILRNIRLVGYSTWKIALRYDIDRTLLDSYGYEGLIMAVDNYDPTMGAKFSSYAIPSIIGYVLRGLKTENQIPSHLDIFYKFNSIKKIVEADYGCTLEEKPSMMDDILDTMVARNLISERQKPAMIRLFAPKQSLEELKETKDMSISAEEGVNYNSLLREIVGNNLEDAMKSILTERERTVIKLRFIDGKNLEEVGKLIGVTRERVRQIEAKAIRKLYRCSELNPISHENMFADYDSYDYEEPFQPFDLDEEDIELRKEEPKRRRTL